MENEVLSSFYAFAEQRKIPLNGAFELTPVCNMDCKMCYIKQSNEYVNKNGGLLSADDWISVAEQIQKEGTLVLVISGGEPLMYPEFKKLYAKLQKMGFLISLNTNGTLLTNELIEWLGERQPDKINITLYGASNKAYYELCGIEDGFDRVSAAIDLLLKSDFNVYLNCSLTKYNYGELEQMESFARQRGLELHVSTYMFPPVRKNAALRDNDARMDIDVAAENSLLVEKLTRQEKYDEFLRLNAKAFENFSAPPMQKNAPHRCRAGKCSYWITWQGVVTPCGLIPSPGVSLFDTDFATAWEYIKMFCSDFTMPPECTSCKYANLCYACPAASLAESGSVSEIPPYACALAKKCAEKITDEYGRIDKNEKM